jgi:hypothetical protein
MNGAMEGSARFTIWFGLALIALGALSLLGITYYFLLLFGSVGIISLVAGGIALTRIRLSGRAGWFECYVGFLALALLVAVSVFFASVTGVKHEVAHEMTWQLGEPVPYRSSEKRIILHFTQYPGYYIQMYSDELLKYLESLPTRRVRVKFVVTTDFGYMRGFHEVAIGERSVEPSWAGGYGATGNVGRSPFHAWE